MNVGVIFSPKNSVINDKKVPNEIVCCQMNNSKNCLRLLKPDLTCL